MPRSVAHTVDSRDGRGWGGGGQSVYRRREEGGRISVVMTGVKSRSSKTINHFSQISTVGTLGRFRDTII